MTLVEDNQLVDEMLSFVISADRVCKLLRRMIDDFFSSRPPKDLSAYDAECVEAILRLAADNLEREITHFCYKTGDAEPEYYAAAANMSEDSRLRHMCDLTADAQNLRNIIWEQRNPHKEEILKELINSPIDESTVCKLRELANA